MEWKYIERALCIIGLFAMMAFRRDLVEETDSSILSQLVSVAFILVLILGLAAVCRIVMKWNEERHEAR